MTKFISLDFWGTIAVFNPAYSAARTKYLADLFGLPEDEAHARYQFVKRKCDHDAEHHGTAVTPLVAVKTLLGEEQLYSSMDAVKVLDNIEQLVRDHPPQLHPKFPALLNRLLNEGFVVGVSSNTNFISGSLLQSIFNLPWSFAVYSDEIGVSKPDPDFFRTVKKRALQCRGIKYSLGKIPHDYRIHHIGDNSICDVEGAQFAGFQRSLVKSPDETIEILKNVLGSA